MSQKDSGSTTRLVPSPQKDAASPIRVSGATRNISPKTIELGRSFLSALFMGLRTAQIHEAANKAFERAVQGVRGTADQLFAATGGFAISFVEDSTYLNGVRLRFEGGQFDSMRTLRHILESKELGGIEMRSPPSFDAIRKLLLMFSSSGTSVEVNRDDLLAAQIGVLGVQRISDQSQDRYRVDRRVFAVQSYAKLILAYREQREAIALLDRPSHAPRLRAVRIVQDLVELCGDRSDFLLRLGSNHSSANVDELHAANVCVLSIALAQAIGLERQDMVDVGVAGLFHDVSRSEAEEPPSFPLLFPNPDLGPVGGLSVGEVTEDITPSDLPSDLLAELQSIQVPGDEDDDAPDGLPVEYMGELRPVDPSELPPISETVDETEKTAVTAMPDMSEHGLDPEASDQSLPAEATLDEHTSQDIEVIPIGVGGTTDAPGHPGHPEELWTANAHPHTGASFTRLLTLGGVSPAGMLRALVAAEHHALSAERYQWGEMRRESHLFSRIIAVADAYDALTSGLGSPDGAPVHPMEALGLLLNAKGGRVDGRIVDLLINVLRAYPTGAEVVLDNGLRAVVTTHTGGSRWDRPVVRTRSEPPEVLDLMVRDQDRFKTRILGTVRAIGDRDPG